MKMSKFAGTCSVEEAIWDVRIHFDALHNLDRKICSSDVTFLNLYALLHTQGFTFSDELYHMENTCIGEQREHGLDLIDTNIKLQNIKKQHEHTLVLNLLVRATATDSAAIQRNAELQTILYAPPVVYDLSEPAVLAVDDQGVVFNSQGSSSTNVGASGFCTQESKNLGKQKLKSVMEDEVLLEEGYYSSDNSEGAYDSDNYLEKYRISQDTEIIDGKRQADEEQLADDQDEYSDDESEEEEQLHYEGDTEVEDPFEMEEEESGDEEMEESLNVELAQQLQVEPPKKKQKLPIRRCPTTRTHSSVLKELKKDFIPSSDEEETGWLMDSEDDGHEPLQFVLKKSKKSRAQKRKPRIWFNEKMEHPHQQLCKYMCFTNQQQFRDALLSLHISQARDFRYHRNSDQRIIACCRNEHCQFHIVAAVIKGEKTFAIKK